MQDESMLLELARIILPSEFVDYFQIVGFEKGKESIEIHLDEFAIIPSDREGHQLESKGFLDAVTIQDFPLRDKRLTFKVRRRKWYDVDRNEYFTNCYDLVAQGTRYSKEFAAFLKALPRDLPRFGPFA